MSPFVKVEAVLILLGLSTSINLQLVIIRIVAWCSLKIEKQQTRRKKERNIGKQKSKALTGQLTLG